MHMDAILELDDVSLDVPTWLQRERDNRSWRAMLLGAAFDPPQRKIHRLLDGISFEARDGDRIGLLGVNGAGKSTLLRILNGAYLPSSGSITINGTRQALLNLSLGFNNEATVRENIFLRGTAMGMKTALIRELIEQILAFSGLEEKASHRLRTLSSGQRMRLGFSISTATQHDIMLMDEWVGTGDAEFMAKAKDRLLSRVAGSKILVLASHSLGLLREICNRGLVLNGGCLVFDGTIGEAIKAYHDIVTRVQAEHAGVGERMQTIGALDSVYFDGDRIRIRGWALQGFIAMPPLLALEIAGERHIINDFKRYERLGVQQRYGLSDPMCGFEAELVIPDLDRLASVEPVLAIYGGSDSENMDGPFTMATAVQISVLEWAKSVQKRNEINLHHC